ncbi:hypothetical protein VKT23_011066 [Stygiomarasmius scandens]|uniref:F-box domain-containing protein n=1 Tax=Marasmiellus scandens TaxID=2682957 RepID=A0ABR1JEY6_9AGAR
MDLDVPFENESAVYRIPPEILEHIFLDCYRDNSIVPSTIDAPFNISLTCTRWREIAICIPRLWSSFSIIFSSTRSKPSLPVLKTWLYRSGFLPISFSLTYHEPKAHSIQVFVDEPNPERDLFRILRVMVEHLSQWESVYIDISDMPYDAPFPSYLDHTLSQISTLTALKSLSVHTFQLHPRHTSDQHPLIPAYFNWLSTLALLAPSLQSYHRYGDSYKSEVLSIPTQNLTTLYLERITEYNCLRVLKGSPRLVECHFARIHFGGEWNHLQVPVRASGLRKLILEPQETNFDTFLPGLVCPNLEHLEILADLRSMRYRYNPLRCVHSFLQQSSCPLLTLILRPILLSGPSLEDCLNLLSSTLTTFAASGLENVDSRRVRQTTWQPATSSYCLEDRVLERLTYTGEPGTILCPRLENIILHRCINAAEGKLGDMIESRWRTDPQVGHVARIKRVDIELFKSDCQADVDKLEGIFAEGLQGSVRLAPGVRLAAKDAVDETPSNVPILQRPSNW